MRIAQVSALYESVPPKLYGGTERVVSYLTEELVHMGRDVTLFASGDSNTSARLVPCCKEALRLDPHCIDPLAHYIVVLERVFQQAEDFDIIHFDCDYLHFPLSTRHAMAAVSTLHGRLDLPDLHRLPELFCGFRRRAGQAPTLYPVACSPQSWAAASVFFILQACLGIRVQASPPRILFRRTVLPASLAQIEIRNLAVGNANCRLADSERRGWR